MRQSTNLVITAATFALLSGCSDPCADTRVACVSESGVTVRIPGAGGETVVTADVLTCSVVSAETSFCTSDADPFPEEVTITADGYAPATVMLSPFRNSTCCGDPDTLYRTGDVTLERLTSDGGPTCALEGERCDVLPCCNAGSRCEGIPVETCGSGG
jgi:hypothetical protein